MTTAAEMLALDHIFFPVTHQRPGQRMGVRASALNFIGAARK
jgi:hypothetical protein